MGSETFGSKDAAGHSGNAVDVTVTENIEYEDRRQLRFQRAGSEEMYFISVLESNRSLDHSIRSSSKPSKWCFLSEIYREVIRSLDELQQKAIEFYHHPGVCFGNTQSDTGRFSKIQEAPGKAISLVSTPITRSVSAIAPGFLTKLQMLTPYRILL